MRRIAFSIGEWYHCYNRGVDKRTIFQSGPDYKRFQMQLYAANSKRTITLSDLGKRTGGPTLEQVMKIERSANLVDLGVYALMPNHYHLLLREKVSGGITSFMRKLDTAYTMYFNLKYKRTGVLFSSKFQSKHIDGDRYLRRVLNYIHANPCSLLDSHTLEASIMEYPFSSFMDYQNVDRIENKIVDTHAILDTTDLDLSFTRMIADADDFERSEVRPQN